MPTTRDEPTPLWDGVAPGSESWHHDEIWFDLVVGGSGRAVRNVVSPTLTAFTDGMPTDRAVIVLPGGALHYLCFETEGEQVAEWLHSNGIAAFALKYRVVPTPADEEGFGKAFMAAFSDYSGTTGATLPLAVADAGRSVEMVRSLGYRHVSLLGFSAGAIVSADLSLHGPVTQRPDSAGIIYAPSMAHTDSDTETPPLFLAAAVDDMLGIQGSLDLFAACRSVARPVELHLFERGGHGFQVDRPDRPVRHWRTLFLDWLSTHSS